MSAEEKRKKLESFVWQADNLQSLYKAYQFKHDLAMKIASIGGMEKGKNDYRPNGTESKVLDCADALEAYAKCAERFSKLEREIIAALDNIQDARIQSIMRRAYLCGYSQQKIADELQISIETVKKMINEGISAIDL